MRPEEPGIRLNVGMSGAGKSHTLKRDVLASVRSGMPVMVIDSMEEWSHVPPDLAPVTAGATSVDDACARVAEGKRLLIVRAPDDVAAFVAACAWARDTPFVAGVAMTEAHDAIPNGPRIDPAVKKCLTAWRHRGVAMWLDTQRLPMLARLVTEQARELRLFAIVGDVDLATVRSIGGRELQACVTEAAHRLANDQPGWHVRLGLVRVEPIGGFKLIREQ